MDRLERAVPKPQRLRATRKLEANVFSSAARRVEMPFEGVPECCSGARSRKDKRRCWHGGRSRPPGACSAEATAPQSPLQVPSDRVRIGCSPLLRTAQVGRAWRCLLKACSGARSRKGKQHHWFGGRGGPPGECCAKATASVRRVQVPSERLAFTCSPRLHAAQVGRAWRCLLKACRSVALALDHERASDTTGSAAVVDYLECAMPEPQRFRAACKLGANVFSSAAHRGSASWRCLS